MKSLLALAILSFPLLSLGQESMSLDAAVRQGRITISSSQEMSRSFGDAGKVIFQNGRVIARNRIDRGLPVCEATVHSTFDDEMTSGYFRAGQILGEARMQTSSSNLNLGPWSRERASVTMTFMGTVQDAARAGVTEASMVSITEMMPGSLSVTLECRGFRTSEPTVADLRGVLGSSMFNVSTTTAFTIRDSILQSGSGQRVQREQAAAAEARRIAREAEVARLNAEREARVQAEVARISAEREARAQAERERLAREQAEREAAARLSILTALDQVGPALPATFRVSEIRDTAIIGIGSGLSSTVINGANNRFNGNIFQNGEHVGYLHQNGDLYGKTDKNLDQRAAYCTIQGAEYRVRRLTQEIDLQSGIFEIESVNHYSALRSISLNLIARDEISSGEEGISKLRLVCHNVTSLEEVQLALGAERFNLRQADAEGVVAEVDSDRGVLELNLEELAGPEATSNVSID